MSATPLLQVHDLETCYGDAQALFGASLTVAEGEFVTLLGRNGMGKTTTVRSTMGIMPPRRGRIVFAGQDITHLPSHQIARLGIGLVPEQRQVFANLTVYENLVATAHNRLNQREPWTLDRVYQLFPRLKERAGNLGANLSGGEQQMLAIGRALVAAPRVLLLDEPSLGLAPVIVKVVYEALSNTLRETTVLLVEQSTGHALNLCDEAIVLAQGRISAKGNKSIFTREYLQKAYMGR